MGLPGAVDTKATLYNMSSNISSTNTSKSFNHVWVSLPNKAGSFGKLPLFCNPKYILGEFTTNLF